MNLDPQEATRLRSLKRDFDAVGTQLLALTEAALNGGATSYPIFVASREPIGLGLPALSAKELGLNWNFRISPLEELVRKKLILAENVDNFKQAFGDPLDRACLLMVEGETAKFVFFPYEAEQQL